MTQVVTELESCLRGAAGDHTSASSPEPTIDLKLAAFLSGVSKQSGTSVPPQERGDCCHGRDPNLCRGRHERRMGQGRSSCRRPGYCRTASRRAAVGCASWSHLIRFWGLPLSAALPWPRPGSLSFCRSLIAPFATSRRPMPPQPSARTPKSMPPPAAHRGPQHQPNPANWKAPVPSSPNRPVAGRHRDDSALRTPSKRFSRAASCPARSLSCCESPLPASRWRPTRVWRCWRRRKA